MSQSVTDKAKKFGQLLANSPLAEELKKALLDNLEFMPERNIDALIVALENEAQGLEIVAQEAEAYLQKQDDDWNKLEKDQEAAAAKILKEEMKKLEEEARIESLRSDLAAS